MNKTLTALFLSLALATGCTATGAAVAGRTACAVGCKLCDATEAACGCSVNYPPPTAGGSTDAGAE